MRLARAGKLRWRLLLLVGMTAVPVLGLIIHTNLEQRDAAAAEAHREAAALAYMASSDYQRIVAEARQLLMLLSRLPDVHAASPAECGRFLSRLLTDDAPWRNLGLIRPDGQLVCSALHFEPPVDLSDRSYFRRALESGEFSIGDFQVGRVTGEAAVNFGTPVRDEEGDVEGVVYAALPLVWLQQRAVRADLPEGSIIVVVDPAGTLLARFPERPDWIGRDIRDTPLGRAIQATGGVGSAEEEALDGVERLFAFQPLEAAGVSRVTIAVGIPSRVAFAEAQRGLARNLALLAFITLFVLGIAWWGSDFFVLRHVRGLVEATGRLASGDLRARAKTADDRGELAELARSFNTMADALEKRAREADGHLHRISRLNRVQRVLSGINSTILRIRDRQALLDEVCRISVEEGRFPAVWIAEPDEEGVATVTARAGDAGDLVDHLPPSTEGDPVSDALRTGKVIVANDVESDSCTAAWRDVLRNFGYRSLAALPVGKDGAVEGILVLCSLEAGVFDRDEMRLLRDVAGDAALGLESIANEEHIEYIANYDSLTGLANRTLFSERLRLAVGIARTGRHTTAVLLLKIDRFGQLTATAGQHVGDATLEMLARYLTESVSEGDTVSRVGSGEFGVVLAELEAPEDAAGLAGAILDGAPTSFEGDDETVFITYSMGVALYPHDAEDAGGLVRNATLALRTATQSAHNSYAFFSSELDTRARRRHLIEKQLRKALAADELTLAYQPVVDLETRRVIGVESLLRWENADLGTISPAEFIPVAEETGLISSIGEWILRTACLQGREWHERGFRDIHMNVNVSVRQLAEDGFVDRIEQILAEARFDPRALALGIEITETELMENVASTVPSITRLREMGLDVYIDDFGTGYSSLSYLRELPIDTLKVDISFIRDLPDNADAVAVVRAIIALARGLELRVIAEGVETEGQLKLLQEMGCDSVQGFLFSRPGTPEEIEPLFEQPVTV